MQSGSLWVVEPGQQIGPFRIGQQVNQAVAIIQKFRAEAEVSFSESDPHGVDIIIRLPQLGLQLTFDGYAQTLHVIIVWLGPADSRPSSPLSNNAGETGHFGHHQLSYCGRVFSGIQGITPNMRDIYALFGPSYLGDFHRGCDGPSYFLKYPGLTFEFSLPEDSFDSLSDTGEHPIELPKSESLSDGAVPCSPSARKLWVFPAASQSFLQPSIPDIIDFVVVKVGIGILVPRRQKDQNSTHMLRFGAMPQDVLSDLGPPEQVSVKDFDHMKIHASGVRHAATSSAKTDKSLVTSPDYYYNFSSLGMDILFDGASHGVSKVLLYQNAPTHELFGRYSRCFFKIPIDKRKKMSSPTNEEKKRRKQKKDAHSSTARRPDSKEEQVIDVRWSWTQIQDAIGVCGRPLVVNQPSRSTGAAGPFGSTHFYAYPGIIFEVMSNGYVSSVTVFPLANDQILPVFQEEQENVKGGETSRESVT
eukprot:GEMP01011056.1.p1 GENE.GEMP01011056.1~~GEMP01011056.1.p1  ORF type:complete len:474 (+),score=61.77 GEMP01011056.1:50-1471(+)